LAQVSGEPLPQDRNSLDSGDLPRAQADFLTQGPGMARAVVDTARRSTQRSTVRAQASDDVEPTAEGADQWMERYVAELNRPPDTAEQLRAFAKNRAGRLSYSEARRAMAPQQAVGPGAGSGTRPERAEGTMQAMPPEQPDWRAVAVERRRFRLEWMLAEAMTHFLGESMPWQTVMQHAIAEKRARDSCKRILSLAAAVEPSAEEVCAICLENAGSTSKPGYWRVIPCGHKFHEECLTKLGNCPGSCKCPLCRFDLRAIAA